MASRTCLFLLSDQAKELLEKEEIIIGEEVTIRRFTNGLPDQIETKVIYGCSVYCSLSDELLEGSFEAYALKKYLFSDGRVFYERLQACSWNSKPTFFLALQDEQGEWVPESLWDL